MEEKMVFFHVKILIWVFCIKTRVFIVFFSSQWLEKKTLNIVTVSLNLKEATMTTVLFQC